MSEGAIKVKIREEVGTQAVKPLRRAGEVPGIYYTHGEDSISLQVNAKELKTLLAKEINIIDITFPDGKICKSVVRDVQTDPVTDEPVHVDFMGIRLTEVIKLTIPLVLTGTAAGVKEGGILEHLLREVEVEGLPLEIPDHIEVDVSELAIGDSIRLEDITLEKVQFATEIHHVVAHVVQPKLVEEVEEELEEELEEGEVAEEAEEASEE